jgi:predicted transposase YbfD/YdcC
MGAIERFLDEVRTIDDPRIERCKLHPLPEIFLATLAGVIGNAEGWQDIEDFAAAKLEVLREYLPYVNGVPSDDTLRRFFRTLDPRRFQECFMAWVRTLRALPEASVIAIDGKTSRGSQDGAASALHLVSAFATEARRVLGQGKVADKSNEITAIPELLDLLDIAGHVITIDAIGTQKNIAAKIVEKEADYVLALKGNQSTLHDDVRLFFEQPPSDALLLTHEETDKGHGRIEVRRCRVTGDIAWLKDTHDWSGLTSIVGIESTRIIDGEPSSETRFYITSLPPDPVRILRAVRSHWAIENSLHWVLDMTFGDDASRIRKDHAPMNLSIIRQAALNLLQQAKPKRQSIRSLRNNAGWDSTTLRRILAYANL